jgi:hypothetical chaperone protein
MPGRLLQFLKTALRTEGIEGTQVFDRYLTVAEIVAIYLRELKVRAERLLGEEIEGVTLGRPVKFSLKPELDRRAEDTLREAAEQAGYKHITFELEPVAAALYYELSLEKPENVLIFDFGGGTLDITIMRLGDSGHRKVYANGGIDIAGSDFDRAIIRKRMLRHFGKGQLRDNHDISELIEAVSDWQTLPELSVPKARVRLQQAIQAGRAPVRMRALEALIYNDLAFSFYRAVEEAKIELSNQDAAVVRLEEKDIDIWELYTRWQFEFDIREHRERIETVLLDTVAVSGLEPEQIDAVVKTGGSSSIPLFTQMLVALFGKEKVKESSAFSSVTAGLGVKSAIS